MRVLQRANTLVRAKIHPTSIMAGYRLAMKEAVKYIKENLTIPSDKMERDYLIMAVRGRALPACARVGVAGGQVDGRCDRCLACARARACVPPQAKTSMSSKIIGPDCEFFSKMVVEAVTAVKTGGDGGKVKYPIKVPRALLLLPRAPPPARCCPCCYGCCRFFCGWCSYCL